MCAVPRRAGTSVSPDVPALTGAGQELTVAQLEHIINHGLGESENPTKPYMPVWGEVISNRQVSDLVAYIRANVLLAGAEPAFVPADQGEPVAGAALYGKYGCINCHGPNGLGGVPILVARQGDSGPLRRGFLQRVRH